MRGWQGIDWYSTDNPGRNSENPTRYFIDDKKCHPAIENSTRNFVDALNTTEHDRK